MVRGSDIKAYEYFFTKFKIVDIKTCSFHKLVIEAFFIINHNSHFVVKLLILYIEFEVWGGYVFPSLEKIRNFITDRVMNDRFFDGNFNFLPLAVFKL